MQHSSICPILNAETEKSLIYTQYIYCAFEWANEVNVFYGVAVILYKELKINEYLWKQVNILTGRRELLLSDVDNMRGTGLPGSLLVKCGDFSLGLPRILLIHWRIKFSFFLHCFTTQNDFWSFVQYFFLISPTINTIKIHFICCLRHSWLKNNDLLYRRFGDQPLTTQRGGPITYQSHFYGLIVLRKYDLWSPDFCFLWVGCPRQVCKIS